MHRRLEAGNAKVGQSERGSALRGRVPVPIKQWGKKPPMTLQSPWEQRGVWGQISINQSLPPKNELESTYRDPGVWSGCRSSTSTSTSSTSAGGRSQVYLRPGDRQRSQSSRALSLQNFGRNCKNLSKLTRPSSSGSLCSSPLGDLSHHPRNPCC